MSQYDQNIHVRIRLGSALRLRTKENYTISCKSLTDLPAVCRDLGPYGHLLTPGS